MKLKVYHLITLLISFQLQAQAPTFEIVGDPTSANGATWTFKGQDNDIYYDLEGILFKPQGNDTYPAVVINHGTGSSAALYSKRMAKEMVKWGYVCIATNLCHSSNVPIGAPGDTSYVNYGASLPNIQRAMKCRDILVSLDYVDTTCIAAFGHSRGAFVTTAIVGLFPDKFSVAGHSAGGIEDLEKGTTPTTEMANGITVPYTFHHGDKDNVVPIELDRKLKKVFEANNIVHEFYEYSDYTHNDISFDPVMLERTRTWFIKYGCNSITTGTAIDEFNKYISFYPNPSKDVVQIRFSAGYTEDFFLRITNVQGKELFANNLEQEEAGKYSIDISNLHSGVYFISLSNGTTTKVLKIIKE